MRIAFDSFNRYEQPQISLCNIGCTFDSGDDQTQYLMDGKLSNTLGVIDGVCDLEIVANFNALSQVNFRVYKPTNVLETSYARDYAMYDAIKDKRLLFVNPYGFFQITSLTVGYDGVNSYKDVGGDSIEVELENKTVPYIADGTYAFTDLLEDLVEVAPLWLIDHIDTAVSAKSRTFEDVDTDENILSFMLDDMQEAYECIFLFDIANRTINVYDQNNYVVQTDIHLTKDDLIQSVDIQETTDSVYTALLVHGEDDLNISPVNPLGGNTIYNFDYYLSWMTSALSTKVSTWQNAIVTQGTTYKGYSQQYYEALNDVSTYTAEVERLDNLLSLYRRCKENIVAESGFDGETGDTDKAYDNLASYNTAIQSSGGSVVVMAASISGTLTNITNLITTTTTARATAAQSLATAQSTRDAKKALMDAISDALEIETYFTQSEYSELANYIFEGSYTDEYTKVIDSMTWAQKFTQYQTLYDRAVKQLESISQPTQQFTIDTENFLFDKSFKDWSEDLETGCLINVEVADNDIACLFLSTITVNYEDQTLSMTFGNRFNKFDPRSLYEDVLGDVEKSANTLNYVKEILYPIKSGELEYVKTVLENSRNLTKNNSMAASNQSVVIDDTGYSGRKIVDGDIDDKQVKITNNTMVFTDDGWDTCKVALGEIQIDDTTKVYGVNADTLIGTMIIGNELQILSADDDNKTIFEVMENNIISAVATEKDDRNAALTQMTSNILQSVSDNYTSKEEAEEQTASTMSLIQQNSNGITAVVSRLDTTDSEVTAMGSTLNTYFVFDSDGLTIGKTDNEVHLKLENDVIKFEQNGTALAYWNASTFVITDVEATNSLKLGEFGFIPRSNGNLDFKVVQ